MYYLKKKSNGLQSNWVSYQLILAVFDYRINYRLFSSFQHNRYMGCGLGYQRIFTLQEKILGELLFSKFGCNSFSGL